MLKIRVRSDEIRLRRKRHPTLKRQKTLAPALGISVRTLHEIEKGNRTWDKDFIEQLANRLGTRLDEIVFAVDGPKLVSSDTPQSPAVTSNLRCTGKQLVPRFDNESARLVRDPEALFESARKAQAVLVESQIELNEELAAYAEELVALARETCRNGSWEYIDPEIPRAKEIVARMRWLLVQLKGNDVLMFVCDHMKNLPESDEVVEQRSLDWQFQAIIAFAPPQEWGEDSVYVNVDNGQPYIIDWDKPLFSPSRAST
jgi:transcriptional regulator with XRE-family HTH domain